MTRALLLAVTLLTAASASAQRTARVRVVDVAGGRAYIEPGEDRGLRAGQQVTFGRRRFRVATTSRTSAVLELGDRSLRVGARGRARVRRPRRNADQGSGLPEVTPLSAFRGQWPEPRRPALDQHPDPVPLGGGVDADDRLRLSALVGGLLRVPLGQEGALLGRGVARVRLHAEPLRERPFRVDVDAQAQLWLGGDISHRPGDGSRPYLLVRRLELAYGRDASVALGRLRRASAVVGTLDGARVRTPTFRGLSFGAFGGVIPNPTDGTPNLDVGRFGVEAHFERPDAPLRPVGTLVAHGSTYQGIDERRLAAEFYVFPDWGSAGAFAELSMFRPNNRWNAPRVDLTTLAVDFGFRTGPLSAHVHGSLRKPERSRLLDSLLPPEWTCTQTPQSGAPPTEPCAGRYDARHYGSADVGVELAERIDLRVGGTVAHTGTRDTLDVGTGYLQLRVARLADLVRASVMAEASGGSLLRRYGGRLEIGAGPIAGMLDLAVHYGLAAGMLRADQKRYIEHRAGGSVYLSVNRHWRFRLMADALAGGPTSAMLVQAQLIWAL